MLLTGMMKVTSSNLLKAMEPWRERGEAKCDTRDVMKAPCDPVSCSLTKKNQH